MCATMRSVASRTRRRISSAEGSRGCMERKDSLSYAAAICPGDPTLERDASNSFQVTRTATVSCARAVRPSASVTCTRTWRWSTWRGRAPRTSKMIGVLRARGLATTPPAVQRTWRNGGRRSVVRSRNWAMQVRSGNSAETVRSDLQAAVVEHHLLAPGDQDLAGEEAHHRAARARRGDPRLVSAGGDHGALRREPGARRLLFNDTAAT